MKYANIIVDISVEKLDKTFQYSIPENLQEEIQVGVQVDIPFGNRKLTGYVIELTEDAEFDPRRIRPIISVHEGSVAMESQLIALAGWMRKNYGSTMNQALKTVLPIRRQTKEVQKREIVLLIPKTEAQGQYRPGEKVSCRVTNVREDGKLNLSPRKKAYQQMDEDSELVLKVIGEYAGVLPFDDKVSPEVIKREFGLSKAAFKRAVGHLLKEKKIKIQDKRIYLIF